MTIWYRGGLRSQDHRILEVTFRWIECTNLHSWNLRRCFIISPRDPWKVPTLEDKGVTQGPKAPLKSVPLSISFAFCLHPKRRYINALLVALAVVFSYQVLEPPRALNASGLLGRFHRCTHCIHHHQFDMADRIRSGAVLEESVFLIWDFEFSGMSAFSLRKHTAQPWLLNTRLTFFSPRGTQDATDHHQKHQKQVVLGR